MKFFFTPRHRALAVALSVVAVSSGAVMLTRAADAQTPASPANATWLDALDLSKMTTGYGKPQSKLS